MYISNMLVLFPTNLLLDWWCPSQCPVSLNWSDLSVYMYIALSSFLLRIHWKLLTLIGTGPWTIFWQWFWVVSRNLNMFCSYSTAPWISPLRASALSCHTFTSLFPIKWPTVLTNTFLNFLIALPCTVPFKTLLVVCPLDISWKFTKVIFNCISLPLKDFRFLTSRRVSWTLGTSPWRLCYMLTGFFLGILSFAWSVMCLGLFLA